MNIVLVLIGLVGFRYVVLQKRAGLWFSLVQAASGIFAFSIHSLFILQGHPEFTLPASELLLGLTLLVSLAQAVVAIALLRAP
jgi:hypothetical protein